MDRKSEAVSSPDKRRLKFGRRERELVVGVAMKFLRNREDAEDAAQDAMLRAYVHRDSFRAESQYTTWLYTIASTTALMYLRKRRGILARGRVGDDACATMHAPGLDPEKRTIAKADAARAVRCIDEMHATRGQIVRMSVAEGYSAAEIGAELGISVMTVKNHVHRGRVAVRAALADAA